MGSALQGLFVLLQNLPAILEVLKKLGELAESGVHYLDVRIQLKKLDKAIDHAKETKDTSGIEGVLNPKSNPSPSRDS